VNAFSSATRTFAPEPRGERLDRLDALRGAAMVWMVFFHFSFDLNHFHLLTPPQRFLSDPFWTVQRVGIVTVFLFCAGLGQAVALSSAQDWSRFWRRWGQVAACAVGVSAGSALMFPRTWISFGVLHGIAVMLLLLRWGAVPLLRRWPADGWRVQGLLWTLGGLALVAPVLWQHPVFDARTLNWTGLVTRLPATEDYVPLLPWLGVVVWGLATGLGLLARRRHWLAGELPRPLQPLAVLGRWSLSVYMLHQPVLIGLIWVWLALMRPATAA
jgi:uncharacterized membrane protein